MSEKTVTWLNVTILNRHNEMAAAITRIKESGDPKGATKLASALRAMLEQSLGVVG